MNQPAKTRSRTMSMEQRLVCEWFQVNPNTTRPQCAAGVGLDHKSVMRKVESLVQSGHLVAMSDTRFRAFSYTGKPFPHSDAYVANQKWLAQCARHADLLANHAAVADIVAASVRAMVLVGRAAA